MTSEYGGAANFIAVTALVTSGKPVDKPPTDQPREAIGGAAPLACVVAVWPLLFWRWDRRRSHAGNSAGRAGRAGLGLRRYAGWGRLQPVRLWRRAHHRQPQGAQLDLRVSQAGGADTAGRGGQAYEQAYCMP